jgi:PAS domain S-box-containing protein
MREFRHQPIRRKLLLLSLIMVAVSMLLVMIGLAAYEYSTYRQRLARELSEDAAFIAANSAPPLAFGDAGTATEILATLEALPEITVAVLYTADDEVFASYLRPDQPKILPPPAPGPEGLRATNQYLVLVRAVAQKEQRLGTLYLQADTSAHMQEQMIRYAMIVMVVGLAITGGALLLQKLLDRLISEPLLQVARMAERIAAGDLKVQLPVASDDEIGQLARSFNHMTVELAHSYAGLEEGRARLAGIIEGTTDLIAAIDLDFRFIAFNRAYRDAFVEIFGSDIELGMSLMEALAHLPEEQTRLTGIWGRALNGEEFTIEREFVTGKMVRKHMEMIFSSIRNQQGELIGASHIARDITDRKQAEEEMEQLLMDLARSNRELEQFAYVASHDLQEPLRMVASYVQLLEKKYRDKLDEKAIQYIDFAVDGAVRMQKLIEGLLAYSRISRRGNQFKQIATNEIFSQALANLAATIKENQARITRDELPLLSGDETQLIQLFQNLLSNAIKYRKPETPPVVHVSASLAEKEWLFAVRDNGIGIEPRYFDRIFLIFQRLHTRREYPGTGLGLALCKRIVERHHGRIWVESTPGHGSTFFFTLPARREKGL